MHIPTCTRTHSTSFVSWNLCHSRMNLVDVAALYPSINIEDGVKENTCKYVQYMQIQTKYIHKINIKYIQKKSTSICLYMQVCVGIIMNVYVFCLNVCIWRYASSKVCELSPVYCIFSLMKKEIQEASTPLRSTASAPNG